jgi:hypothetical protein
VNDTLEAVLQRFEAAAAKFMTCVDSAPTLERDVFLLKVERSLAELYCTALAIPAVEPESEHANKTAFPTEQWRALHGSLGEKFGEVDVHWLLFDSRQNDEPVQATLSAHISEIYYDLKRNLQLKENGMGQADLMWESRFHFLVHWGRHALQALKAIYDLQHDKDLLD